MQTINEIGKKISVARKLKNLSQSELALQMAVTSQAVGKWERGESMPDIIAFGRLATVLGVDLNYFAENTATGSEDSLAADTHAETEGTHTEEEKQETDVQKPAWDMSGGYWKDADFSGLAGLGQRFRGANIQNCKFIGSELSRLELRGNNVVDSDFSQSDLSFCRFTGCNIQNSLFNECNFSNSAYHGTNIEKGQFDGADFTGAFFKKSNIGDVSVAGAKWLRTVFNMTHLAGVTFDGEITDCAFEGWQPVRVVFRNVTLKNTFFKNCNLKKLRFENCRADNLTLAFLKNSFADISGITRLKE